jgi:hypothetical protein
MYRPLNHHLREVRLLTIQPGDKGSRIEAKLSTYTLPSYLPGDYPKGQFTAPEYDALSYEWGDPNATKHSIILDGQPFEVRENLYRALEMLRAMSVMFKGRRPLWVDAICINQNDIQERSHQVRMMGHIYRWAEWVRVWLGGCTNGDTEAFELMRRILEVLWSPQSPTGFQDPRGSVYDLFEPLYTAMISSDEDCQSEWEKIYAAQRASTKPCYQGIWNFEGWGALACFFERSYWSRIWIVQEYLLARHLTIHVGMLGISEDYMKALLTTFDRLDPELRAELPLPFIQTVDRINNSVGKKINDMRKHTWRMPLVDLMETIRNSNCQVANDRIYAILGLATDSATFDSIPIDYGRSPFKVKMDIAWAVQQRPDRKHDDVYLSRIIALVCEVFSSVPDEPD